jgi:hypothetical protein
MKILGLIIGLFVIMAPVGLDIVIKKRRVARRTSMTGDSFLREVRGKKTTPNDLRVLEIRDAIARELELPLDKIYPKDNLYQLRDYYCPAISGHLALSDLLDDLALISKDSKQESPSTVEEFISRSVEIDLK